MHSILLEKLRFQAYHGVFEEETKIGGTYEVNCMMKVDFTKAAKDDQLEGTLDYSQAYQIIKNEMMISSKLIEHVGGRIHSKLKSNFPEIQFLSLKISKLNPPISGEIDRVSIVIED